MRGSRVRKAAFTLAELVIVVVIIGVIAAIAVPRMSRGATGTAEVALKANLRALRSAIDLYAAEHNGCFPGHRKSDGSEAGGGAAPDFYAQLLECSTPAGATGACSPPRVLGPYLRKIPRLNVGKNADLKSDEVAFNTQVPLKEIEANQRGWLYNPEHGEIIANTKAVDSQSEPFAKY